jgi:hypothetical protein
VRSPSLSLVDDVADTAVETLDDAIGLRMTWRNESVLDVELLAQPVRACAIKLPGKGQRG